MEWGKKREWILFLGYLDLPEIIFPEKPNFIYRQLIFRYAKREGATEREREKVY